VKQRGKRVSSGLIHKKHKNETNLEKTGAVIARVPAPNMQESDAFGVIYVDIAKVFFALLPI